MVLNLHFRSVDEFLSESQRLFAQSVTCGEFLLPRALAKWFSIMIIIISEPIRMHTALFSPEVYVLCVYFFPFLYYYLILFENIPNILLQRNAWTFISGGQREAGWKKKKANDVRLVPKVTTEGQVCVWTSHITCPDLNLCVYWMRAVT